MATGGDPQLAGIRDGIRRPSTLGRRGNVLACEADASIRGRKIFMVVRGSVRGLLVAGEHPGTYEAACETAYGGLRDAVDLALIHNEGPVTGDAPRGVLNPLMLMLAVSAWERLVYELAAPAGVQLKPTATVGRFRHKETAKILQAAAGGALPHSYRLTLYTSAQGKRLGGKVPLENPADWSALAETFDEFVEIRNGIAHRVVPDKMAGRGTWRTDAGRHLGEPQEGQRDLRGLTINTSLARCALAGYIQLVDQTIAHVCAANEVPAARAAKLRLPHVWFDDDGSSPDKWRSFEPGCLWGGTRLPRT
jgi:hypothetical protein